MLTAANSAPRLLPSSVRFHPHSVENPGKVDVHMIRKLAPGLGAQDNATTARTNRIETIAAKR